MPHDIDPDHIELRPMGQSDVPAVMRIETAAYSHPWTERIIRDCLNVGYSSWVMTQFGVLLGYGFLSVVADECHVLNVTVDPEQQNQGFGRRLMTHLLERGRLAGAEKCFLEVRPSNHAAMHLYVSLGFREVGRRKGYYPAEVGREDAVVLMAALGASGTGS